MKNIFKTIIVLLVVSSSALAQENNPIELKDLKTPSSPAFQILDIAPTSIERPTNPRTFTASMLSLSNNGTSIPKNFAMEFAPFWFFKSKDASVYSYFNIKKVGNNKDSKFELKSIPFNGILKKMSASLASSYSDSTSGSLLKKTNYISFGVRTNLITIRSEQQMINVKTNLSNYAKRIRQLNKNPLYDNLMDTLSISNKILNNIKRRLKATDVPHDSIPIYQNLKEQEIAKMAVLGYRIDILDKAQPIDLEKTVSLDKELQEIYKNLEELPRFQVDVAFAYSEAYPDNQNINKRFNRSGFWLNLAYNINKINIDGSGDLGKLSIIGSFRGINDNVLQVNNIDVFKRTNAYDWGAKLQYTLNNLSISYEYLKRDYSDVKENNSERSVGLIQYKINDDLYFIGSHGKNFGIVNKLFTLFGLQYGFGNKKLTNPSN